jgi:hypothetical protein
MTKSLIIKEVPVDLASFHPPPPNDILPRHEFSMGLIAPKGSGKTTLLVNLLMYYKQHFHTIIVFSPTVKNDDKWVYAKKQKLLLENLPLKKFLKSLEKKKDKTAFVMGRPKNTPIDGSTSVDIVTGSCETKNTVFDPQIPEDCFIEEYSEADLVSILHEQQKMINLLSKHGKSKHLANRMLLIFDDLVGSSLFSRTRTNHFKKLNTNHRHSSVSILEVTQAYKEIPKTVRVNFTCLILFKIFNAKEVECIYEEYPMGLAKDEWYTTYEYCVNGEHDFLFYDISKPPQMRIMKNFQQYVYKNIDENF